MENLFEFENIIHERCIMVSKYILLLKSDVKDKNII